MVIPILFYKVSDLIAIFVRKYFTMNFDRQLLDNLTAQAQGKLIYS